MRTPVVEMLGVEYPILAFSHCRDVVAAVSRGGGMGVLGAVGHTPEQLEQELSWIEEQVGDRPYGVDVLIPAKLSGGEQDLDPARWESMIDDEHREFVRSLLERYDVPPLGPDEGRRRQGPGSVGSPAMAKELIDVALAHRTRLVANALGTPPPWFVEEAKGRGVVTAALAGTRQHAERHVNAGVDIVVAQGYEAGGHTGEITTMVLLPEVVDAVAPTPVLAAGGIASGRQMAAAMALGAQGVWTGSVWLTTEEAETHPVVKEKFLKATARDTVRSRASTGKPARQLRTAWTEEWDSPDTPDPLGMPLHGMLISEARQAIARSAHTPGSGASQLINYFVGQVVGSMNQVKPARQVLLEMVEEYAEVAGRFAAQVEDARLEDAKA